MLRPFSLVIPFTVQKGEITGESCSDDVSLCEGSGEFIYFLSVEGQCLIREDDSVIFSPDEEYLT